MPRRTCRNDPLPGAARPFRTKRPGGAKGEGGRTFRYLRIGRQDPRGLPGTEVPTLDRRTGLDQVQVPPHLLTPASLPAPNQCREQVGDQRCLGERGRFRFGPGARAQESTLSERAAWRDIPTSANVRRGMRTCTGAGPAVLGHLAAGSAAIGRWEVSLELKVGLRCGPGEGCVAEGEHPAVRGHQPVPALSRSDRDADDGGVEVCYAG